MAPLHAHRILPRVSSVWVGGGRGWRIRAGSSESPELVLDWRLQFSHYPEVVLPSVFLLLAQRPILVSLSTSSVSLFSRQWCSGALRIFPQIALPLSAVTWGKSLLFSES